MQPEIRPYQRDHRQALGQLLNETPAQGEWSTPRLAERLAAVQARGGRIWTLFHDGLLSGYALVDPVPGLEGIYDLQGCIAVRQRRRGLATALLGRIIADLSGSSANQIAHPVKSLEGVAAQFLLSQGFFIEHQEWQMALDDLSRPFPARLPAGFTLQIFPLPLAISHFRHLYESSFSDTPWYQPYRSGEEVAVELADAADLQFLMQDGHPVGFAWLHWPEPGEAVIEPIGLVRTHQGHGLGRPFLEAVVSQAVQQGAARITLGVWLDNKAAIQLYQNIGFKPIATTTYLAYEIDGEPKVSQ